MSKELEELVAFLHHGNSQIRQVAIENLLGYSQSQPSIFKINSFEPMQDLKLLVRDYAPISKSALTILINLADDKEFLHKLATDDAFIETLLLRITNAKERNANEIAMLFANLAKADETLRLLTMKRVIPKPLSASDLAIDQLMDCFVKGADGSYNKHADFDYLSYFFADLAKFPECRAYFTTPQPHDNNIIPLTKLTVFTEHASHIRRLGVASTIKNVSFDVHSHPKLLAPHYVPPNKPLLTLSSENKVEEEEEHINILPYVLLPLCGPEEFSAEDMDSMLEDLQLLPPQKRRERDKEIIKTHLETLLLLTAEKEGRETLRRVKTYPVVRELHIAVEDEQVREGADRLVQVLMRDEEGEESGDFAGGGVSGVSIGGGGMVVEDRRVKEQTIVEEVDSDDDIVEVL